MAKNPAWDKLLNIIPAEFHSQIEPVLSEWDQGVSQQFNKYSPYKALIDNQVDPAFVADALRFAQDFEKDPKAFMGRVNEQLDLGYMPAEQARQVTQEDDLFGEQDSKKAILESPEFKQMREAVLEMQRRDQEAEEERQREAELDAFDAEIDSFLENKGQVNKLFFSSLRAAGLSNEAAWEQYQKEVATLLGKEYVPNTGEQPSGGQAPVIMSSDGNSGSGNPQDAVEYGKLKNNDLDDIVIQMLQAQQGN